MRNDNLHTETIWKLVVVLIGFRNIFFYIFLYTACQSGAILLLAGILPPCNHLYSIITKYFSGLLIREMKSCIQNGFLLNSFSKRNESFVSELFNKNSLFCHRTKDPQQNYFLWVNITSKNVTTRKKINTLSIKMIVL